MKPTRVCLHYLTRRLGAEVLLDGNSQAGAPAASTATAGRVGDPSAPRDPLLDSYFLTQFGRPERVTPCACERRSEVTITQLLELENSDELRHKTTTPEGHLSELLKSQPDNHKLMSELFLTTLSREPTAAETTTIVKALADGSPREEVFQDLLWALLNAKEFVFNWLKRSC